MGDAACSVIRTNNPRLSNYEIDQLINSWDASKSAFENLLNTTWTFDPLVYENVPQYLGLKSNFNYERYNKLQLLSDKVLFSNLSTGFLDRLTHTTLKPYSDAAIASQQLDEPNKTSSRLQENFSSNNLYTLMSGLKMPTSSTLITLSRRSAIFAESIAPLNI